LDDQTQKCISEVKSTLAGKIIAAVQAARKITAIVMGVGSTRIIQKTNSRVGPLPDRPQGYDLAHEHAVVLAR
jgi:hypothetical protein